MRSKMRTCIFMMFSSIILFISGTSDLLLAKGNVKLTESYLYRNNGNSKIQTDHFNNPDDVHLCLKFISKNARATELTTITLEWVEGVWGYVISDKVSVALIVSHKKFAF